MNPMLTKAARAVGDCIRQERPLGVPATNADIARAVLQAIREPDEGMITAGIVERHDSGVPEAWRLATENIWRAMIDHILNTAD